jgi:hypothetical protein
VKPIGRAISRGVRIPAWPEVSGPKHYRRWEGHGDVTKGDHQPTWEESVIKVLRDGPVFDWHDPDFHDPDEDFTWDVLKAAWET